MPIVLRPWSPDDLGILYLTLGDPAMTAHLGGPETPEQIATRHQRFLALPTTEGMFAIRNGDVSVGKIGFWETTWDEERVYETGWFVLPAYAGRGIASEAATAVAALARAQRRNRFLHAFPSTANVPSNKVCEKAGFANRGERTFEYPKGHFMQCNDWRLELFAL